MKIWNIIGLLGLLICLAGVCISCSDDSSSIDPYGRKKRGDVYMAFQLEKDPVFLATRSIEESYGTKKERKVSSVYMLLYAAGGDNSQLLYRIPIAAKTDGDEDFKGLDVAHGDNTYFVSQPVNLKKQDYQLVVLVNPTNDLLASVAKSEEDAGVNCNTLGDLKTAVTNTSASNFYNNEETDFFMTNAGDVIFVPENRLYKKGNEAVSNPVLVPVERLVAKISVHKGFDSNNATLGGKIGAVTWTIDVSNKHTYLMRQQDYLITGAKESGFHTERKDVYARDPNFNINMEFLSDEAKRKEHFNLFTHKDNAQFIDWNTTATATNYKYLLENTMSKEDQNNDDTDPKTYTSQVLLKVIITEPKGMPGVNNYYSFYDNTETDEAKRWKIFTHAQAMEWINGTFPSDMAALDNILKQAQELTDSPFNFKKGEDEEPSEYVSTSLLTYHKDGLNVYRIPIMHFGVDERVTSEENYGYYGIVRNNIYKITIKSIKGPGIDSSNEGYLSADITINPWYGREWEEDLTPNL